MSELIAFKQVFSYFLDHLDAPVFTSEKYRLQRAENASEKSF